MGKSTIVYKGPFVPSPMGYDVYGYQNGSTSANHIASGVVSGVPAKIQVSGYDTYQFVLRASGVAVAGPDFSDGGKQAVTVVFGAEG
jgi:hypothetical protein